MGGWGGGGRGVGVEVGYVFVSYVWEPAGSDYIELRGDGWAGGWVFGCVGFCIPLGVFVCFPYFRAEMVFRI